jgi:Domain of unknown function (DUF6457)
MTWLSETTELIAQASGIDATALTLETADIDTLLRLAGVAAHSSGERTNAPLLCHVLGRAVALGTPLDELARILDATFDGGG